MLKLSRFHFKKSALLSGLILGLALIAIDATAQSESDKMEENNLKGNDRVILDDSGLIHDNNSPIVASKPAPNALKPQITVKRDLPAGGVSLEKEVRRNESPSTLSFNIFLYIVDKFKAD